MSKNSTIDDIFKTGLQGQEFDNAEALWQRMEPQLTLQQRKRDKKKLLLLLLLVAAGSAVVTYTITSLGYKKTVQNQVPPAGNAAHLVNHTDPAAPYTGEAAGSNRGIRDNKTMPPGYNGVIASATAGPLRPGIAGNRSSGNRQFISGNRPARTRVRTSDGAAEETLPEAFAETATQLPALPAVSTEEPVTPITVAPSVAELKAAVKKEPAAVTTDEAIAKTPLPVVKKEKKKLSELPNKVQLELAAGIDPFRGFSNGGNYALVLMRIPLNNKANVLLGAGYNKHSMSESYKIAGKESALTREVDAKVQGLTMLQFPILYEQPIPKSRFIARIGVTPVYIMEANVVNVANSFNGSVIPFRSFTLNDVNRFSVLFTPALQYRLTNKLSAEVRGNYGLTGLVKNSYINQSSENNNFKSIQVGMMFRLGKK